MTESDKTEGLTEKQRRAIPHLINSPSHTEGCRRAGISRKTLYEWLKDPLFKDEMNRQRDAIIEDALDSLKGSMTEAVTTLRTLLTTTDKDPLKRYVAKDIIDYVIKARELEDLDKRVKDLEEAIKNERNQLTL